MSLHIHAGPFRHALHEAEARLAKIEESIAALEVERQQLRAAVDSLRPLVDQSYRQARPVEMEPKSSVDEVRKSVPKRGPSDTAAWKVAEDVFLTTRNVPLSVPELQQKFAASGFHVDQKTIRAGMYRKKDRFAPVGFGKWHLRVFPDGPVRELTPEELDQLGSEYGREDQRELSVS